MTIWIGQAAEKRAFWFDFFWKLSRSFVWAKLYLTGQSGRNTIVVNHSDNLDGPGCCKEDRQKGKVRYDNLDHRTRPACCRNAG